MAAKRLSPLRLSLICIVAIAAWISAGALSVVSAQPLTAARGARPSEFEPGSTDTRLLGCWIETR
jgi:hypothetical protein